MADLRILILRVVLGIVGGVVLWRFFFPQAPLVFIAGLSAVLVGLAYLIEYLRQRKS